VSEATSAQLSIFQDERLHKLATVRWVRVSSTAASWTPLCTGSTRMTLSRGQTNATSSNVVGARYRSGAGARPRLLVVFHPIPRCVQEHCVCKLHIRLSINPFFGGAILAFTAWCPPLLLASTSWGTSTLPWINTTNGGLNGGTSPRSFCVVFSLVLH
jgi:hypothetical protein